MKRKRRPDPWRDGLYPIQVPRAQGLMAAIFGGGYLTNFDAVAKRPRREKWKAPPRPGYE